jgi:hypothetical protein
MMFTVDVVHNARSATKPHYAKITFDRKQNNIFILIYTCFVATFHVFPRTEEVASRNQMSPSTQERQQQKEECFFPSLQTLHQYPNK